MQAALEPDVLVVKKMNIRFPFHFPSSQSITWSTWIPS